MKCTLSIIAVLSLCLFSCKEGWTDEYENEYLESCRERAGEWTHNKQVMEDYCNCALQHTMQHYPTIDAVVENADSSQLSAELGHCRAAALKRQ